MDEMPDEATDFLITEAETLSLQFIMDILHTQSRNSFTFFHKLNKSTGIKIRFLDF